MSARRSSHLSPATAEELPKPASAVDTSGSVERAPESSRRSAERKAVLIEYFVNDNDKSTARRAGDAVSHPARPSPEGARENTNPPPEMREMDVAWEEALLLYGDEDSDAWTSALEDGTHPLCRVRMAKRPV